MHIVNKFDKDNQPLARHAHCTFCGGKGPDLSAESVTSPANGRTFRVPRSHTACKQSILSLSLSLSLEQPTDKDNEVK
jgi:hypothetical protein